MIALTHLYKLRTLSMLKFISPNSIDRNQIQLCSMGFVFCIAKNLRFYGREGIVPIEICDSCLPEASIDSSQKIRKISRATRKGAQAALLEYLHLTRSIRFTDAENMSVNSPHFLAKLLQKVNIEADIGWSVTNFLRYHPINEFEPFFESLGLNPYEVIPLLPRNLMFLSDDALLLENYYALCNYGIPKNKIGRIYKEATEVFRCECGILELKLQAYEQLGLSQSFVCKLVACSPYLLIGDVNLDFMKVLEVLTKGVEFGWIEGHLLEKSYNWSRMLRTLNIFSKTGYSGEQLGDLISQHPGILFEGSGNIIFSLIGFLFKFGSSVDQIWSMFLQFPHMQVARFVSNLRRCFLFLTEIEMEVSDIRKIVCSHTILLGSFTLKKTNTILVQLNVWKKRLCKLIQDNPQEMKKWELGSRIERLPNSGEELRSKILKSKFLLDIGIAENQDKMEKALKLFRGRGTELQERFDCIVKAGLDRKDVCEMVRISPEILNQKKEVIEKKIDFYVNDLGYSLSYLVTYPSYLNYSIQRVKLRSAMYNWLKEQGTVDCPHALSTVLASAENLFVRQFVKHHPRGLEVWQDLKKKLYPQ